jgi:hypothetical protein
MNSWLHEINMVLHNQKCQRLDWRPLYIFFESNQILNNSDIVSFLKEKDEVFRNLYIYHFVQEQKLLPHFRNRLSSFCASWVFFIHSKQKQ